jgi:isoquinoline 1-oxidoreductase beta subunit
VLEAGFKDGKPVIGAVNAGVHCNFCVNLGAPWRRRCWCRGDGIVDHAAGRAITSDGMVEQSNFRRLHCRASDRCGRGLLCTSPSQDPPKGMGEPGLPPFAPALVNALRRATGKATRIAVPLA